MKFSIKEEIMIVLNCKSAELHRQEGSQQMPRPEHEGGTGGAMSKGGRTNLRLKSLK